MKRMTMAAMVFGLVVIACALSSYSKVFQDTYKVKSTSNLGKASCIVCHTSKMGGKLNAYGLDVQKVLKTSTLPRLTPELLKKIENLDSNKNGVKNIDEIKKDQLPGAVK